MSAIAASFTDKSEPKSVIANGVKVNGEKYMTIEASDDSLKAKKVRSLFHRDTPHSPNIAQTPILFSTTRLCTDTDMYTVIGQGRRRSLQDNPSASDRTPLRRSPDPQRLQQRRRAGRVPQEGRLLSLERYIRGLFIFQGYLHTAWWMK